MEIRNWGHTQAASDTFFSDIQAATDTFEDTPRQPRTFWGHTQAASDNFKDTHRQPLTILRSHAGSLGQFCQYLWAAILVTTGFWHLGDVITHGDVTHHWGHTQAASDNFEDTPRQPRIILSIFTTGFTTGFWHLGDIIAWWCRASLHIQCKLGQWQHRQGLHLYRNMTSKERKFECKHPWGGGYGGMVPTKLMKGWGTIIRMHTVIQITVWLSVVNCWIRDPTTISVN